MEYNVVSWNNVVILSIGVFLITLILRSLSRSTPSLTRQNVGLFVHFLKALLTSKTDAEARRRLFQSYQGACILNDREKFMSMNGIWIKHAHFFKPETVQLLFNSSVGDDKSWEYRFLHPWLGTGLLTSSRNKWKSRRKLLTPTFHFSILKDFIPVFNDHSFTLVKKLGSLKKEEWIDAVPVITLCTLDIICETAMGIRMNIQHGNSEDYVKAIDEMVNTFMNRALNVLLRFDAIYYSLPAGRRYLKNLKHVRDFTRKVIKEKKDLHEKRCAVSSSENFPSSKKKAFLELLLEHHYSDENFTEEDIREEVDTFMFEGHDTTSAAISWTLYCLGLYPEIQENVFEELKSIFQDDMKRTVTNEDLSNMNYLERVIKETIRLYPPVPVIARELKESIQIMGNTITPGFTCLVGIYALHRDEKRFPNPEKFDPDRFLPENVANMHPFSYIPFSAGPRNCIGQRFAFFEVKIVLAHILRNFKVISLDSRDKIKIMWGFILKNFDPLRIKFIARNPSDLD